MSTSRSVAQLDTFLTVAPPKHRALKAVDSFRSANFLHVQSKETIRKTEFLKNFNTRVVRRVSCDLCLKKKHLVRICPRFLQMTVGDRLSISKGNSFLQLLCKQPLIPGLQKRLRLFHLPRSASHVVESKQRPNYYADSIRPSKQYSPLFHNFVLFSEVSRVPRTKSPSYE